MKNTFSGESRGFAYVSYSSRSAAVKAKEALNYTILIDSELRIAFKTQVNNFDPKANVFIKNLPKEIRSKELDDLCKKFGELHSCVVKSDSQGASLGYGYAQFRKAEDALKAVEGLNKKEELGRVLEAEIFQSTKERTKEKTNIYVRNFPQDWTRKQVEDFLEKELRTVGPVTCSGVYSNEEKGEERFYGFVAYNEEEDAKRAIDKYHGSKLNGHQEEDKEENRLYVVYVVPKHIRKTQLAKKNQDSKNLTNLYIKSLRFDVAADDLEAAFSQFGEVTSVCVKDAPPNTRQDSPALKFGFVNFKNAEDAQEAFVEGKKEPKVLSLIHEEKAKTAFLFFAQPKAVRQQYNKMRANLQSGFQAPHRFDMRQMTGGPGMPGIPGMPGMPNMPNMPNIPGMNMSGIKPPAMGYNDSTGFIVSSLQKEDKKEEKEDGKVDVKWFKNNKKAFLDFEDEKKRNMMGEIMIEKVKKSGLVTNDDVAKVTGMLIDLEILDYEEIIDMFENDESLNERVLEALEVLQDE